MILRRIFPSFLWVTVVKEVYDKAKQKIESSLEIHARPKDKEFWHGYILALIDHNLVSEDEWRQLRDLICGWRKP